MKVSEQLILRKRVYAMLGRCEKKLTVHHFVQEGYNRRTIYNIISRYTKGLPIGNLPKKPKPRKLNKNELNKLKTYTENKVGVSLRKLARKFKVSKSCIAETLKYLNLKYHKRVEAPKYSDQQLSKIPLRCRKLRRTCFNKNVCIILDDEKYFTFSNGFLSINKGYYKEKNKAALPEVKYIQKGKFEHKVLVWCAISSKGISDMFIKSSRGFAINSETYIRHCLTKLRKFIDTNHKDEEIIFWPDLASSHYSKKVLQWLNANNINYVPKEANPPNVPAARPIENFWAILSNYVYAEGWEAKSEAQLIGRIRRCAKKIDMNTVQTMMKGIKRKLRRIEDNGPFAVLK